MKRKLLCLFGLFITIAFLSASFDSVYATLAIDETSKIPRILLQWSEYKANGNLTELKRIRTEIVRQLELHEELIKSTNGAVLQPPVGYRTTYHYLTVAWVSPDQYNPYLPEPKIAWVENGENLGGTSGPDGNYARLVARNFFGQQWVRL